MSIKATYTSVWDGGIEISTECFYNTKTNVVYNIESVDVNGLGYLDDEYVTLPSGEVLRDCIFEY